MSEKWERREKKLKAKKERMGKHGQSLKRVLQLVLKKARLIGLDVVY